MGKNLRDLIQSIHGILPNQIGNTINPIITSIEHNSSKVKTGSAFVAIEGYKVDGHDYISQAIQNGAALIVCQEKRYQDILDVIPSDKELVLLPVSDTRKTLSDLAREYYDHITDRMTLVGVTGTNGKTTITYMMRSIWEAAGIQSGIIGTIYYEYGDKKIKGKTTTPDILELYQMFEEMVQLGITHCIMEVSSHALMLDRVSSLNFDAIIFTNLSEDHLDFHNTMEEYLAAKLHAFDILSSINSIDKKNQKTKYAVLNMDIPYYSAINNHINHLGNIKTLTYSLSQHNGLYASQVRLNPTHSLFYANHQSDSIQIQSSMPGEFNLYNALAVIGTGVCLGIDMKAIAKGLEIVRVPGRMEKVQLNETYPPFLILVDYAHTDDALKNVIQSTRQFTKGKIITVFGAGGDRDKGKRYLMGKVSALLSDYTIITSDNPRSEDPEAIINDIEVGVKEFNGLYIKVPSREKAIYMAVEKASADDCVIIAGKGHEDYQILKEKTIHFDDRETAYKALQLRFQNEHNNDLTKELD